MLWVLFAVFVLLLCVVAVVSRRRLRVEAIYVYPVKSMRGVALESAVVVDALMTGDREFAVVDNSNRILTQRDKRKLGELQPQFGSDGLSIIDGDRRIDGIKSTGATVTAFPRESLEWGNATVSAVDCGDDVAAFLTESLGRAARLVRARPRDASAQIHARFYDGPLIFHDASPLLVASQQIPGNFRPNIVVNARGFEEDYWDEIALGDDLRLRVCKPCHRCVVTAASPGTLEPLTTLRRLDRLAPDVFGASPLFGLNCAPIHPGTVRVGDRVVVTRKRRASWLHLE
ncbi:hypothetical protein CTAYLR_003969 [Chrysophaeum taylorii]|uniref:MOSC domain-containing protein n=1 Tax=Chrysophaeum taylorii TaxID=2483200 RepID=A0AAD7UDS2_9STRA|nr:hypothetical protein CTAYLR_003969 [Chrysophaeum taylorii]